jgi:hypothetical protein
MNEARSLPGRTRTVAVEVEVVHSRIHPLVVEVGRNSEVCKYVNIDTRDERASNPTGSSLAGVGTAVVVELHILRGIQIQDSPTFLLADVIEKKKGG